MFLSDTDADLPPELDDRPERWRHQVLGGGHWPMLTRPEALHALLVSVVGDVRG
ncbi:hypothetical protein [Serinicoccus kebangsaanensis]|uniref:hypothetical protein n=1 Tax=Serinicoccus kebangsaanensis TaxID=2602069 RepID=UPI001EE21CA5|nr:hypothetical protein [Serinicoccus kebangsaanensis]